MPRVDVERANSTTRLRPRKFLTRAFSKVLYILEMRQERSGRVCLAINGNTYGYRSANYPTRAWLCFASAVFVLHCHPCSAAGGSLHYGTVSPTWEDSNHKRGLSPSSTSDSFTTVRTLHVLLLGNVIVCRRSSVRLHVLVEHPHQDIHLRHPWWPDCAEDVKVSIVQERNLHVESFHWRSSRSASRSTSSKTSSLCSSLGVLEDHQLYFDRTVQAWPSSAPVKHT